MRDTLPNEANNIECGILNLDSINGPGTHWTCWYKNKKLCYYFDSFGIYSPKEFNEYIKCDILSSTYKIQRENDVICGHLCLLLLYYLTVKKENFHDILKTFLLKENGRR